VVGDKMERKTGEINGEIKEKKENWKVKQMKCKETSIQN
jgi:hypothetical protein